MDNGADCFSITLAGKTPLNFAISAGQAQMVLYLLSVNPIQAQTVDQTQQSTMLMHAADSARVCQKNGFGTSILQAFIDVGVDINSRDKNGHSALDRVCITSGVVDAFRLLVANGAKIIHKVSASFPMTNLMMAAMNGHLEIVVLFLEEFVEDRHERTANGTTTLQLARAAGHGRITGLFKNIS